MQLQGRDPGHMCTCVGIVSSNAHLGTIIGITEGGQACKHLSDRLIGGVHSVVGALEEEVSLQ